MTKDYQPGIYFGMTDDEYHAIPLISASHIKNLLISPMDFWARSWMNPWREEEEESDAKIIGKAYHKRILEGVAAFDAEYAETFTPEAGVTYLETIDDMKQVLAENNIALKSAARKPDYVAAVLGLGQGHLILDNAKAAHAEANTGKTLLSAQIVHRIHLAAAMIENHPSLKTYFVGGYPEVTIIWFDEEFQIMVKSRIDYLKIKATNDLKTFANQMGKSIEKAVYNEIANRKYFIQAWLYLRAVEAARKMVAEGKIVNKGAIAINEEWLKAFAEYKGDTTFNFVMQQKGVAPVAVGGTFHPSELEKMQVGTFVNDAVQTFKINEAKYGSDPWVDDREPILLLEAQFPQYIYQI